MTGGDLVLTAGGSHLYPGAKGSVRGETGHGSCLVEFADGSAALGRLTAGGGRIELEIGPYTTARGTRIPAKRWAVGISGVGAERRFRILGRLPSL
jgi:hypothetical protein